MVFKDYSDSTFVCEDQLDRFEDAPISCGPYKYHSHVGEDYVQLERFDDWFGWGMTFTANNGQDYTFPDKDVAFKYVRFRTIPESAMALVELRTGGVDVTTSPLSSESDFLDVVSEPNFDGYRKSALGGDIMGLNIQGDWPTYWGGSGNFPVSQDWFRKALSHTINRTNIVENVYLGLAEERNTIFPDWILAKFPNIDTSSYYDFDQGFAEAEALLDAQGYTALGFPNEPDNRFGYGVYANETEVNSVEQSSGRHFSLITTNCDHCVKRAIAIQKDFAQIGIYTDIALYEFGVYLDNLYSGDTGFDYNTTGPQPDPNFIGPDWDFYVGGFGGNYETPWDYIAYQNFVYWLYYGYGGYSWYNIDFEIAYAKATDGWGYVDYYDAPPADYPYPVPEWSNYDVQFVQACEDAGYLMSQAMNKVPLVWKTNTYAYNSHLQNFVGARNSLFHVAYSYWDQNTGEPTTTTTTTGSTTTTTIPKITPFLEIYAVIGLSLLVVPWFRKRRIK